MPLFVGIVVVLDMMCPWSLLGL
eukprot:SAG31_NODE_40896_length_278_cov_1.150838_1_plen_22_part_10